ncbi:MAG: S41 family peptidase [Reichenbachiella sp.]
MKKFIVVWVGVLGLVGLFSFSTLEDSYFEISRNLNIFVTLFRELNTHYVDELKTEELVTESIDAMLKSLDPYADFIPESELEKYRTSTTGEYGGIGAVVGKKNGINTMIMPYKGFPAEKSGLIIGDKILKIDGVDLEGVSSKEVSNMLKGQPDTKVMLEVQRYGQEQLLTVEVIRAKIIISNVAYHGMISADIGYIMLSDFTTHASKETAKALNALKSMGATKIILDLRDNPGGLLDEAIKVANVFVPKGELIVQTKGKKTSWDNVYKAPGNSTDEEIPLVVLTSSGTASAAEIVSGVIQDYDRGVLIGKRTFGKGLVQATRPLPYNAQLKITTAKYYIPSGRCIQAIDYSSRNPDGSVGKMPDSLKVAFKTRKGRTVYDGGGIDPDVKVERENYSNILFNLVTENYLFDYATIYHAGHEDVGLAREFGLSTQEYTEFVAWMEAKDIEYTSHMDQAIIRLEKMAVEEKYFDDMESAIIVLKSKVALIEKNFLLDYKDEVKFLLEQEIVSRYYLHEGMIEVALKEDPAIEMAKNVLVDPTRYNNILSK